MGILLYITPQGLHGNKGDARREVQYQWYVNGAHVNHEVISARFVSAIAILIVHTRWYPGTDPQGCWPPALCEGCMVVLSKGNVIPVLGEDVKRLALRRGHYHFGIRICPCCPTSRTMDCAMIV